MSEKPSRRQICMRIAEIRRKLHGDRGKVHFAKQLGISPSTYNYYETDRVPPATLLVRMAEAASVDLRWLLTGQQSPAPVPADHPAVRRMLDLLKDRPEAVEPLTAFVDLLAGSLAWPGKPTPAEPLAAFDGDVDSARRDWIPVLGRSAAGVPHFWAEDADPGGLTHLADLVARHAGRTPQRVTSAIADDDAGPMEGVAQIVTLTAPDDEGVVEFVVAASIKRKCPDAFAVRIDGDSMAPEIRHGELVICSPSVPAADGRPAVVQLEDQIGVTCKIVRREGDAVHLVPVNEQYPPQSFPAAGVVWALRVLARVSAV